MTDPFLPPAGDSAATPPRAAHPSRTPIDDARDARHTAEAVLYEIRRVIVGQDAMLERVLVALLAGGHLLLEGVPGLAKTLTIKTLADVLDVKKLINTVEKRKGVAALGETLVGQLPYYERWIAAFSTISFTKGFFTPTELARKMAEVDARFAEASSE